MTTFHSFKGGPVSGYTDTETMAPSSPIIDNFIQQKEYFPYKQGAKIEQTKVLAINKARQKTCAERKSLARKPSLK
ncbi:hypothetical protein KR100_00190 [Synechococcus sp. KORDI-100]|nr:hypothetical protein KR100_00190 [Synechococcus sp. KORDI-100]